MARRYAGRRDRSPRPTCIGSSCGPAAECLSISRTSSRSKPTSPNGTSTSSRSVLRGTAWASTPASRSPDCAKPRPPGAWAIYWRDRNLRFHEYNRSSAPAKCADTLRLHREQRRPHLLGLRAGLGRSPVRKQSARSPAETSGRQRPPSRWSARLRRSSGTFRVWPTITINSRSTRGTYPWYY